MRQFLDLAPLAVVIAIGFAVGFVGEGVHAYLTSQQPLGHHLNDMLRSGAFGGVAGCFVGTVLTIVLLRRRANRR